MLRLIEREDWYQESVTNGGSGCCCHEVSVLRLEHSLLMSSLTQGIFITRGIFNQVVLTSLTNALLQRSIHKVINIATLQPLNASIFV